ncbi:MAG: hypothetical protein JW987_15290 [Anaerolineaceae bacterium]|nr:hypothetical protein [Anaerolineaceae bacterium]
MKNVQTYNRTLRFLSTTIVLALLLFINNWSTTAATISLDITNPVCVQARSDTGTCYIKAFDISANGSGGSFSQLSVYVNGKLRLNMQGFFESSAYLNADMIGTGLAVACGMPNASGDPAFGNIYTLSVTASMTDGANTWGSAQVRCPYYDGKVFLPNVRR